MADRYWITGGTGNFNSTTNWSTTSGGSSGASVPGTADIARFDANSGSGVATVNVASEINGLICTGYTGSIDLSSTLKVRITFTLDTTMSITNTSLLTIGYSTSAATWFFAGLTLPCPVNFEGTGAKTMTSNVTIQGLVTWVSICNLSGSAYAIYAQGGWTGTSYFNDAATNPKVYLQGGTLTGVLPNSQTGCYLNPTISNVVFATGTTYQTDVRETTYLQYSASTYSVVHTNAITRFISFAGKIKASGVSWNTLQFAAGTYTLEENLNMVNFLTITGSPTINGAGYKAYVSGDVICYGVGTYDGSFDGIEMTGTGTFGSTTSPAGASLDSTFTFGMNLVINSSGTVTFNNKTIYFNNTKKMSYVAGTIVTTGCTWETSSSYEFDLDVTIPTLNNATQASTMTISGNITCTTYTQVAGAYLKIGNVDTLTISTYCYINGTSSATPTVSPVSGTGYLVYSGTLANCKISQCSFTSIDASGSAVPIFTWYGSSSSSPNVYVVTGSSLTNIVGVVS